MKRDMDLIRLLMLEAESGEKPPELSSYDDDTICGHVALLLDAGFIDGKAFAGSDGVIRRAIIKRLTWTGHEFLDASRDPTLWQQAKDKVLKPGASWTLAVLMEFLKAEARKRLGDLLPP